MTKRRSSKTRTAPAPLRQSRSLKLVAGVAAGLIARGDTLQILV
jgi:hypothetical protein